MSRPTTSGLVAAMAAGLVLLMTACGPAAPPPTPTVIPGDAISLETTPPSMTAQVEAQADPAPPSPQSSAPTAELQIEPDPEAPTADSAAMEPRLLSSGSFAGVGDYDGSGTAAFFQEADGAITLRLMDGFSVSQGPELFVYLVDTDTPADAASFGDSAVELAPLRTPSGDQRYVVPAGIDVSQFSHVVIFCKPFDVVFSAAPVAGS